MKKYYIHFGHKALKSFIHQYNINKELGLNGHKINFDEYNLINLYPYMLQGFV